MSGLLRALALVACLALATSARADPAVSGPLRVELRVEHEVDLQLFERLRGQTSDLPVELERYPARAPLGSFADVVTQAFARCAEGDADVVLWARVAQEPQASSWIVAIATCRDGRVLARRLPSARPAGGNRGAAGSAALESAALVLRGALSVLVQGGSLGLVSRAAQADPNAQPAARADDGWVSAEASAMHADEAPSGASAGRDEGSQETSAHAGGPSSASASAASGAAAGSRAPVAMARDPAAKASRRVHASTDTTSSFVPIASGRDPFNGFAFLGWEHTWDGTGAFGQPAITAGLGLGPARFQLGLVGSFSFGSAQRDPYATVTLARHRVAAQWRQRLWRPADWGSSVGLDAGSVLYHRETRARTGAAEARAPVLSAALLLSPFACIARRIGLFWLALSGALDILPLVPRFVYRLQDSGETQEAARLWPLAPRVLLSLSAGRP